MQWSQTKPQAPGWYYVRNLSSNVPPTTIETVELRTSYDHRLWRCRLGVAAVSLSDMYIGAEWAGPLPEPPT